MDPTAHFYHSTLRERIVEHIFVGDALRTLWQRGIVDVEVLRSEFDAHGYDLVMTRGNIVRHIQLKSGTVRKPGKVSVALALASKPSGCVIWIRVHPIFRWGHCIGSEARQGKLCHRFAHLPNPLRATHNKEGVRPARQNHRAVPASEFRLLATFDEVLEALFGPLPHMAPPLLPAGADSDDDDASA